MVLPILALALTRLPPGITTGSRVKKAMDASWFNFTSHHNVCDVVGGRDGREPRE